MGRIILVTGGGRRAAEKYTLKSLAYAESYPRSPFWLDLLSPSERLLARISNAFRLNPGSVRACLSRHRQPSCEDFGDYLFIQTTVLAPSRKNLFIQRDIKILLSQEYLITLHKSQTPLYCSFSSSHISGFTQTGRLLLTIFDDSIANLMLSLCSERTSIVFPVQECQTSTRNPLWWRLRNLRAALIRDGNLLHSIAAAGGRIFAPEDANLFESIRAKIYLLCDAINRLLSRMDPVVELAIKETGKKIL